MARDGRLAVQPFLRSRFFRIVPAYLFSAALAVAVSAHAVNWLSLHGLRQLLDVVFLGLKGWRMTEPNALGMVNAGVVWSLKYEWVFYFLLTAFAGLVIGGGHWRIVLVFVGFAVFGSSPALFFFPGVLAIYVNRSPRAVRWLRGRAAAVAVILMTLLFPLATGDGFGPVALVMTTLIFLPIAGGNSVFGLLTTRALRLMGVVSYSVYLMHGIILYMARPDLAKLQQSGLVRGYWMHIYGWGIGVLVLSLVSYRFVEWTFIQYERKMRSSPRTEDLVKPENAAT